MVQFTFSDLLGKAGIDSRLGISGNASIVDWLKSTPRSRDKDSVKDTITGLFSQAIKVAFPVFIRFTR